MFTEEQTRSFVADYRLLNYFRQGATDELETSRCDTQGNIDDEVHPYNIHAIGYLEMVTFVHIRQAYWAKEPSEQD